MAVLSRAAATGAALAFALVGCGSGRRPTTEPWFAERGQKAATWHACVRLGALLRSECDGGSACQAQVTTEVTRSCYAARYRAETDTADRADGSPSETLSPCFWPTEAEAAANPADYAQAQCDDLALGPELAPHCVAELRAVIEGLCTEGSTDLTGAGP